MRNLRITEKIIRVGDRPVRFTCVPVWVVASSLKGDLKQWQIHDALPASAREMTLPDMLWTTVRALRLSFALTELTRSTGQRLFHLAFQRKDLVGVFDGTYLTPAFITEEAARASLR